jgi:hypothetical protein
MEQDASPTSSVKDQQHKGKSRVPMERDPPRSPRQVSAPNNQGPSKGPSYAATAHSNYVPHTQAPEPQPAAPSATEETNASEKAAHSNPSDICLDLSHFPPILVKMMHHILQKMPAPPEDLPPG